MLADLFSVGKRLLRRVEVLVLLAAACAFVIPAIRGLPDAPLAAPIESIALGVILASMYVMCRSLRLYLTRDNSRLTSLTHEARLDGASLAARSVRHAVGNKLAVTVGYSELLLDDPRLPEDVHQQAQLIFNSAMAAANSVQKLDTSRLDLTVDTSLAGPTVVNLQSPDPVDHDAPTHSTALAHGRPQPEPDAGTLEWTHR